jgi:hypothetical protein
MRTWWHTKPKGPTFGAMEAGFPDTPPVTRRMTKC